MMPLDLVEAIRCEFMPQTTTTEGAIGVVVEHGGVELEQYSAAHIVRILSNDASMDWRAIVGNFDDVLYYYMGNTSESPSERGRDVLGVVVATFAIAHGIEKGYGTGTEIGNLCGALFWARHELGDGRVAALMQYALNAKSNALLRSHIPLPLELKPPVETR